MANVIRSIFMCLCVVVFFHGNFAQAARFNNDVSDVSHGIIAGANTRTGGAAIGDFDDEDGVNGEVAAGDLTTPLDHYLLGCLDAIHAGKTVRTASAFAAKIGRRLLVSVHGNRLAITREQSEFGDTALVSGGSFKGLEEAQAVLRGICK